MSRPAAVAATVIVAFLLLLAAGVWQVASFFESADVASFGAIFDDCPSCGARVTLAPGRETSCPRCGRKLAACGRCGRTLSGPAVAEHQPGSPWLCAEHRAEETWEAACLRELDGAEARTPPPDTPRAVAARRLLESRVRDLLARNEPPGDRLFPGDQRLPVEPAGDAPGPLPRSVVEAHRFYSRAVTERDNGSVAVFRWDLDGSPVFVVRCTTDGSGGFTELYDADGTALGYARTEDDDPVWTSRGLTRRRAFVGDRDEVDDQRTGAAARLPGRRP